MAEALPSRTETTGAEAPSGTEVLPVVIIGDQTCPSWPRFAWIALASSVAVHAAMVLAVWSRASAPADSLALRSGRASVALQMSLPSVATPAPKPMEMEVTAVDAETPQPLRAVENRPAREHADVEPSRAPDPPDDPASELARRPSLATRRATAQRLTAMPQVQPEQVRHRRRRPLTPPPPSSSSPLAAAVSDPGVERETPEPLSSNRPPVYPPEAVAARAAGTTRLRVTVSDEGAVVALEVQQSSGWSMLDQAALSAVATWRFEPQPKSIRGGNQTVIIPVVFQLDRR